MTTAVNSDFHDVKSNFHVMITVVYQLPTVNLVQPNITLPPFLITIQHTIHWLVCRKSFSRSMVSLLLPLLDLFLWLGSLRETNKSTCSQASLCKPDWSLSKMILVPTDQRSFSRLFVVTCLHRSMVSFPPTHSTCLYKPMVSYPSPPPPTCLYRPMVSCPSPHLFVQTHGLLSIPPTCLYRPMVSYLSPPPVCTDPWSLTHPPHLSAQTHGLLPIPPPVFTDPWSLTHPPTCLYRPMVSYPSPPHLSVQTHGLLPIPPTCLYRPMVSYPSPHLSVQTHGLLPIPPPVCTYPWSLTHPPHLSVQTHGLLPIPPTCLYRPMVSCLAPPPPQKKSGSRACKIVLTTSLKFAKNKGEKSYLQSSSKIIGRFSILTSV